METLAVIAYRQPILRADIEAVRGVNCGEILRQLMDRELVRIGGRSEDLGRPYLYTTTKHFLRVFGLDSLDSLPRVERLRRGGPDLAPTTHSADAQGKSLGEVEPLSSEEEGSMPVLTRSGLTWDQPEFERVEDEVVDPRMTKTYDENERQEIVEEEDFDEDDEEDDDEDDEDDFDDELDDEDLEDEELEEEELEEEAEDEELEDEWEEVEDEDEEEDWEDEEDDSEWDDDDDEEEEEEEDEDWE
jgi:segregation and condensation protein B